MLKSSCATPDFVAINKPAGLCVHQDGAAESFTGLLARQLGVARVWLLRRWTSPPAACCCWRSTLKPLSVLAQQFAAHSMHKTYLALKQPKARQKAGLGKRRHGRSAARRIEAAAHAAQPRPSPDFTAAASPPGLRLFVLQPLSGKPTSCAWP